MALTSAILANDLSIVPSAPHRGLQLCTRTAQCTVSLFFTAASNRIYFLPCPSHLPRPVAENGQSGSVSVPLQQTSGQCMGAPNHGRAVVPGHPHQRSASQNKASLPGSSNSKGTLLVSHSPSRRSPVMATLITFHYAGQQGNPPPPPAPPLSLPYPHTLTHARTRFLSSSLTTSGSHVPPSPQHYAITAG